ncbi:MAG: VanW family protein, partial [Clostridia bacterium]|nr:VanW family protein [Clostridia bacterium]
AVLHDPLPGEAENISLAAQKLCQTLVPAGSTFSQNQALGPYTLENGYQEGPSYAGDQVITTVGGGICKIASLLYNAAALANLPILERHAHSMLVPYVPPGQDATVCYGAKDFRFANNLQTPLLIWCQKVDNTVYLAFYSQQKAPVSFWQHQIKKYFPCQTLYQASSSLPAGWFGRLFNSVPNYYPGGSRTKPGTGSGPKLL